MRPDRPTMDRGALAALLLGLVVAFAFQGSRHLWDPDEGRYTNVAHQMVESGDWLVPRLAPERPHFTKPPLTYWAIGASFSVFGSNEWAARIPNALAFVGTALLVMGIARRLGVPAPEFAAAAWTTTLGPVIAANVVTTDTLLAAFETLAVWGFVASGLVGPSPERRRSGLRLMWVGFGLAFLTKGPPGLLPLAAIVAFMAWRRRSQLGGLFDPLGLVLFAGIGFSWYLTLIWRSPELLDYFLVHEVVGRVATGEHHRNSGWFGWLSVYVPTLVVGSLPWGLFAARAWRRHRRSGQATMSLAADARRFLMLWIAVPFVVFALAQSRLPLYVLPLFVPIVLLLASMLGPWPGPDRPARVATGVAALAAIGIKLAGAFVHTDADAHQLAADLRAVVPLGDVQEVVFVDTPARYGLRHYLGLDVAEAQSAPVARGAPVFSPPVTVCEMVQGPRTLLLLAPAARLDEVTAALAACPARVEVVGSLRRWSVLRLRQPPTR
jgi:4-amino-4-deoxy-L-arabinose transferase-like glycosyltransferase